MFVRPKKTLFTHRTNDVYSDYQETIGLLLVEHTCCVDLFAACVKKREIPIRELNVGFVVGVSCSILMMFTR